MDQDIARQIQAHMTERGMTQEQLGRLISPDSKNPRQVVNQYLTGNRSFLTGTARSILEALNLEVTVQPRRSQD